MEEEIIEGLQFSFVPEFSIQESGQDDGKKWIVIGGTALTEGVSLNKNFYSQDNLKENDGRNFKWLFGHPNQPEEHVVGLGNLSLKEGKLCHQGKIRNTVAHPDVVESVKDGFLGPSIHASCRKVMKKEGAYHIEGLSIDGIGLVAFQGVKSASIDYAIAESFEKKMSERMESSQEDAIKNNDQKGEKMVEEQKPVVETVALADHKKIVEELQALKLRNKEALVESIMAINKDLKKDDLMKESEEMLQRVKEYETKLSKKTESVAVVEERQTPAGTNSEIVESKDGSISFGEKAYETFNAEIRARVRG